MAWGRQEAVVMAQCLAVPFLLPSSEGPNYPRQSL